MEPNVLFRRLVEILSRTPDRCVLSAGGTQLSAQSLLTAVQTLSDQLQADFGIRAGATVGLCMSRSIEWVVAQLAVLRLGGVVGQFDPAASSERLHHMVEVLQPTLLLLSDAGQWGGSGIPSWVVPRVSPHAVEALRSTEAPALDLHPAYVMFTSGTTGRPKGVPVPGAGLLRLASSGTSDIALRPGQRWAALASPGFDATLLELWCPLLNGGHCELQPLPHPDLETLASFIQERGITDLLLTTSLFNALVEDHPEAFERVEQVLMGGEQASPSHAAKLLQRYPSVRLINAYGPTENAVVSLCHVVSPADTEHVDGIPIGRPLRSDQVGIDGPGLAEQEAEGELWVAGPGVGLGYLGDAQLSVDRYVSVAGVQWYRTGDRVRRSADGMFHYVGRVDRQVKVRGHRIELDEVELHLDRSPGVAEAIVYLDGDAAHNRHLVAVVVARQAGARVGLQQVRQHLLRHLPPAAVPARLVQVQRLPRNLSGKIDRQRAQRWANGDLESAPQFRARLQAALTEHAHRVALNDQDPPCTYTQLESESARWGAAFKLRGVRSGDVVPLLAPRSAQLVFAMLGLLRIGAAFAPIDMQSPTERVGAVLQSLRPPIFLADGGRRDEFADWQTHCPVLTFAEMAAASSPDVPPAWEDMPASALVYVMFTSGSTGVPKGVEVSDANLGALLSSHPWADFSADARWLWATSPAFDIAMVEIWGALLHGAELHVLPGYLPSLGEMARVIAERGLTHVQLATALFNALIDVHLPSLKGVQQFITGGERASPSHMRRLLLACPTIRLINGYGPTETTVYASVHEVSLEDTWENDGIPIGAPLPGNVVRIDPETSELWVGGQGVASGYWQAPQLTAERFVEHDGRRWYRTGDLAKWHAPGVLAYHGRMDRQIKLQGQRFELDEVELLIARLPDIQEAVVFVVGDQEVGRHLLACVRSSAPVAPREDEMRLAVSRSLPDVAVPKHWFVASSFPVTSNGKVDRVALRKLADAERDAAMAQQAEPVVWASVTESVLADIWSALMPRVTVRRDTHFGKAGGTSILALRVAAEVERRLQRALRPVDVLLHPILSQQAAWIDGLPFVQPTEPSAATVQPGMKWPLTQGQVTLLEASSLDETGRAYIVHLALRLPRDVNLEHLKQGVKRLIQRHPALRMRAQAQHGQWQAWVEDELPQGWWQEHAQRLTAVPDSLEAWDEALLDVIQRPLDLATDASTRVDLWRAAGGELLWVMTVHHAVIDEESVAILLEDLHHMLAGHAVDRPMLDAQSLAAMERHLRQMDDQDSMQDWLNAYRGRRPPLGRVPAPGAERSLEMPVDWCVERGGALDVIRQAGRSPFAVFLLCHARALQSVFGQACRHVSTPFSRRSLPELQGTVTCWVDVPLIEAGCRPEESLLEHLHRLEARIGDLQAEGFDVLHDLAPALAEIDPDAAHMLTQFGMTWRLDPERDVPLGDWRARLLRVPQRASRYGLCLHLSIVGGRLSGSVEAVDAAFRDGWVQAYQRALVAQVEALLAQLPQMNRTHSKTSAEPQPGVSLERLRESWVTWLRCAESDVEPGSNFFSLGGTSLMAMRMAAELQRGAGYKVDLATFMKEPSFAAWINCVSRPGALVEGAQVDADGGVHLGREDAQRFLFLIPGLGGHSLGLVKVARALVDLDPQCQVYIPDVDTMLAGPASGSRLNALLADLSGRCVARAGGRSCAIAGFSLGGLLAIQVASALQREKIVTAAPVFLLDTYDGRLALETASRRWERRLSRWIRRMLGVESSAGAPMSEPGAHWVAKTPAETWVGLERELAASSRTMTPRALRAVLFKAVRSEGAAELLWRRKSNGFAPSSFDQFHIVPIAAHHLDLVREHASAVAAALITQWGQPTSP